MKQGDLLIVTDGSYMRELSDRHAAAAWVLECLITGVQFHGVLPVSGRGSYINPYRAELQGLLAVKKVIDMIA